MNKFRLIITIALLVVLGGCSKVEGLGIVHVYPAYMNVVKVVDPDGNQINIKGLNRQQIDEPLEAAIKDHMLYMVPGKHMKPIDLLIILDLPGDPKYELTVVLNEEPPVKTSRFMQHVTVFPSLAGL